MAEVQLWNQRWGNLLSGDGAAGATPTTTRTSSGRAPPPNRVLATPEFTETDCPIDTTTRFEFDESDILPATSHMEFLGAIC